MSQNSRNLHIVANQRADISITERAYNKSNQYMDNNTFGISVILQIHSGTMHIHINILHQHVVYKISTFRLPSCHF